MTPRIRVLFSLVAALGLSWGWAGCDREEGERGGGPPPAERDLKKAPEPAPSPPATEEPKETPREKEREGAPGPYRPPPYRPPPGDSDDRPRDTPPPNPR